MKVMIIEDDPVSMKLASAILSKNDFDVFEMNSANKAIEFFTTGMVVDIILSDLMMPDASGFTFLQYIKSEKRLETIPVILCTALSDMESVVKGRRLGAVDYIVKPVDSEILMHKINKALEHRPGAVLVVDDEPMFRELLRQILEREGYRVVESESVDMALKKLEMNKISLVLSDVKMPHKSGFELLKNSKEKYPDIPFLLMSGYGKQAGEEPGATEKPDGFISKPFTNIEIIHRIKAMGL